MRRPVHRHHRSPARQRNAGKAERSLTSDVRWASDSGAPSPALGAGDAETVRRGGARMTTVSMSDALVAELGDDVWVAPVAVQRLGWRRIYHAGLVASDLASGLLAAG